MTLPLNTVPLLVPCSSGISYEPSPKDPRAPGKMRPFSPSHFFSPQQGRMFPFFPGRRFVLPILWHHVISVGPDINHPCESLVPISFFLKRNSFPPNGYGTLPRRATFPCRMDFLRPVDSHTPFFFFFFSTDSFTGSRSLPLSGRVVYADFFFFFFWYVGHGPQSDVQRCSVAASGAPLDSAPIRDPSFLFPPIRENPPKSGVLLVNTRAVRFFSTYFPFLFCLPRLCATSAVLFRRFAAIPAFKS